MCVCLSLPYIGRIGLSVLLSLLYIGTNISRSQAAHAKFEAVVKIDRLVQAL